MNMNTHDVIEAIARTLDIRWLLLAQDPSDPEEIAAFVAATDMAARVLDIRWMDLRTAVRDAGESGRSVRHAVIALATAHVGA